VAALLEAGGEVPPGLADRAPAFIDAMEHSL